MDSKNPLIRWTVGPVHDCGFDVLKESVRRMKSIYPEFDLIICHNNLSESQLERIKKFDVELLDQSAYASLSGISPRVGYSVEWKLFPPRLRPESHELFMDNDIILHKRVEGIDKWLGASDCQLLYQGIHGKHGNYSGMVPSGIRINSGIFGLSPYFEFGKKISERIKPFSGYFDEQGLVASILIERPYFIIPLTVVPIVESGWSIKTHDNNMGVCGHHFVYANRREHRPFRELMKKEILI